MSQDATHQNMQGGQKENSRFCQFLGWRSGFPHELHTRNHWRLNRQSFPWTPDSFFNPQIRLPALEHGSTCTTDDADRRTKQHRAFKSADTLCLSPFFDPFRACLTLTSAIVVTNLLEFFRLCHPALLHSSRLFLLDTWAPTGLPDHKRGHVALTRDRAQSLTTALSSASVHNSTQDVRPTASSSVCVRAAKPAAPVHTLDHACTARVLGGGIHRELTAILLRSDPFAT